jgi:hypothetical protein
MLLLFKYALYVAMGVFATHKLHTLCGFLLGKHHLAYYATNTTMSANL